METYTSAATRCLHGHNNQELWGIDDGGGVEGGEDGVGEDPDKDENEPGNEPDMDELLPSPPPPPGGIPGSLSGGVSWPATPQGLSPMLGHQKKSDWHA